MGLKDALLMCDAGAMKPTTLHNRYMIMKMYVNKTKYMRKRKGGKGPFSVSKGKILTGSVAQW